jgi:hypothetical protein
MGCRCRFCLIAGMSTVIEQLVRPCGYSSVRPRINALRHHFSMLICVNHPRAFANLQVYISQFPCLSSLAPCRHTHSHSQDDAGIFGALIIGGGLLGAMIAGPVLDATHAYRPMLKIGAAIAGLGSIYFVVRRNSPPSNTPVSCI